MITILGKSAAALTMILDALESNGDYSEIEVINNLKLSDTLPYDNFKFFIEEFMVLDHSSGNFIIGAMMPKTKMELASVFDAIDRNAFINIFHHSAVTSSQSKIGSGVIVDSFVSISAYAEIGDFVTVYSNSSIAHHCSIGDFVTVCQGCAIAGNVKIGEGSFIGSGSTIKNGVTIGKNCVIGSGSNVIADVIQGGTVYGNPAKEVYGTGHL